RPSAPRPRGARHRPPLAQRRPAVLGSDLCLEHQHERGVQGSIGLMPIRAAETGEAEGATGYRDRRAAGSQPTILFRGYSMIPTAPARRSFGIRSRTVASAITLSTAYHSVPYRLDTVGAVIAGRSAMTAG